MEYVKRIKVFAPGDPVLVRAIQYDYPEAVIKALLAKKANVNRAAFGMTPLSAARARRDSSLEELLLAHGAQERQPTNVNRNTREPERPKRQNPRRPGRK